LTTTGCFKFSNITEYVALINQYGGKMDGAVGVPEDQLRKATASAVCKINIDGWQ